MAENQYPRKRTNFAVGAILFLLAELWRDWFTPTTWSGKLLRFLLAIVSLGFLGASLKQNGDDPR